MPANLVLGLLGDILTFSGGLILAYDAINREREFGKKKDLVNTVSQLREVKLEINGVSLRDQNSVELVFIRESVKVAKWGTVIVTIGFFLLLSRRILDLAQPAASPR